MLPECSIKKILSVLLTMFMVLSTGCGKKTDTITLGEWIHELCSQAGISDFSQNDPYFMSVQSDSPYFKDVQAAVEWGVLNPDNGFDPDSTLNRAWTAGTLMNLAGKKQDTDTGIRDVSDNPFQEQIQAAVALGLMKTDKRKMFSPDASMDRNEALKLLKKTTAFINSREIDESVNDIEWNEDVKVLDVQPQSYDETTSQAVFPEGESYEPGSVLHWKDPQSQEDQWFEVESFEGNTAFLKAVDFMNQTESMDLEGSTDIDFSKAEITDGDGNLIQESASANGGTASLMAFHKDAYTREFSVAGFTVNLKATASGISAEASKQLRVGKAKASVKVNGIHCDYSWKSRKQDVKDAYFKVKFSSTESLSLTNGSYKNLYGDFSKVSSDSFLSSLQGMWAAKKDVVEGTFTIAKIRVPMPGAPIMNLNMNLELHVNAEGKAQLVLTQDNEAGCEVRNGKMRVIRHSDSKANADIRSTASVTAGIRFALDAATVTLVDAGINAGAKALVKTTAHLYDSEGNHQKVQTGIPVDVADEVSDGNGDVLICGDVDAYWVLNVKMNSSSSLLGKLGISKRFDLLDEQNASLLPKGKKHIENFHFVDHCTRGERSVSPSYETIHVTNRITLDDYSFALDAGKSQKIMITGMPQGYHESDLNYASENPAIASVDQNGNVHANASGSAQITIRTNDGRYVIHCSVLVPQVSG